MKPWRLREDVAACPTAILLDVLGEQPYSPNAYRRGTAWRCGFDCVGCGTTFSTVRAGTEHGRRGATDTSCRMPRVLSAQ